LFLLTGFMTYRITRNTINKGSKAISAYKALFDFGLVRPPDAVVARTSVEYIIWIVIMTVFFTATRRILGQEIITNFQGFVMALVLMYYFCLSFSMFNATIGELWPVWRTIWKIMTTPLLFLSGVIYVPAQMPPDILNIIWWNPFLHCVEGIRSTSYLDYLSVYDPTYLFSLSTIVMLIALTVERLFRQDIIKASNEPDEDDFEL
jgi:capsular polysaccharide transport system permease protein